MASPCGSHCKSRSIVTHRAIACCTTTSPAVGDPAVHVAFGLPVPKLGVGLQSGTSCKLWISAPAHSVPRAVMKRDMSVEANPQPLRGRREHDAPLRIRNFVCNMAVRARTSTHFSMTAPASRAPFVGMDYFFQSLTPGPSPGPPMNPTPTKHPICQTTTLSRI